jgi:hypothetical protein
MRIILNIIKPSKGEENGKQYTFQWIYRGEIVYNDIVRPALTLSSRLPEDSKQKNILLCIHCPLGMGITKFQFAV